MFSSDLRDNAIAMGVELFDLAALLMMISYDLKESIGKLCIVVFGFLCWLFVFA